MIKHPRLRFPLSTWAAALVAGPLCWPLAALASDAPAHAPAAAAAPAGPADAGNGSKMLAAAIAAKHAEKAGDAHGAKPGPATDKAAAAKAPPPPPDPMATLREKLAVKLGASKAPDAPSPNVVRVMAKAEPHAPEPVTAAATKAAKPSVGLVAKLRAEKPGGGKAAAGLAGHAHWDYKGEAGPEEWGALKPEFAKCGNGSRQSPIDIRGGVKVDLDPVQFDYRPSGFRVIDNGHTVQVNLASGNSIEVMGRRYDLLQFHFHRPSEERIDGRQFDMSAHLVHRDPEGRLAVVGVLLDRGSAHAVVQTVWNNLPLERNTEVAAQVLLDPNHLLPADRRYYTYMGSLTTPPCSEGVLWMVMQQPVPLSTEQISVFSRLYPMNARPIQSVAGRLIKSSN